MNINMHLIIEALEKDVVETLLSENLTSNIQDVQKLDCLSEENVDTTVFWCTEDELKEKSFLPRYLIYYGSLSINELERNKDTEIIHISSELLPDSLQKVIRDLIKTYNDWENDLLYALVDQNSLSEICGIAAKCIRNPFAVLGNSGRLLAWGGHLPDNYENPIWTSLFTNSFPIEYDDQENTTRELKWWDRKEAVITKHTFKEEEYNALTKVVFIENRRVANLGMTEAVTQITQAEISRVTFFADCILSRYFTYHKDVEQTAGIWDSRLLDVINGIKVDDAVINNWGIISTETNSYYLFFIRPKEEEIANSRLLHYINWYRNISGNTDIIVGKHGGLVILTKANSNSAVSKKAENYLSYIGNDSRCGISESFYDFRNAKYAYIQALYAFGKAKPLAFYSDVVLDHIADLITEDCPLELFITEDVSLLNEYDLKHNTEFLKTTEVLYENAGNKAQTAQRLFLHRNTLDYRLQKISSLLGKEEVFSTENQLHFLLSCKLLHSKNN